MVRGDFDGSGTHALGEPTLGIGWDRLIPICDQKPGRQRFPGWDPHHLLEGGSSQWLLHREHDPGLYWINVCGEVVYEVVLWQPGDVSGQRGQRKLGCGDGVAVGLQALDDGAPTGAVGPDAVDEHDVRESGHFVVPSLRVNVITR